MIKLLCFDLDGTLCDTLADLANAINYTRQHYQLQPLPEQEIRLAIGDGVKQLIERTFPECSELQEITTFYKNYYMKNCCNFTRLYPGVSETLNYFHDKVKLAVITNKIEFTTQKILQHFDILKYFELVIGGDTFEYIKPNPYSFNYALNLFSVNAKEAWMIGDHDTDIATAYNAGADSAFFTEGIGKISELKPTLCFSDYYELPKLLNL